MHCCNKPGQSRRSEFAITALLLGVVATGCSKSDLTEAIVEEHLMGEIVTFENARYPYFEFNDAQELRTRIVAQKGKRKNAKVVTTVDVIDRNAAIECAGNLLLTLDWTDGWKLSKVRPVKPHPFTCRPLASDAGASASKPGNDGNTGRQARASSNGPALSPGLPAGSRPDNVGEFVDEMSAKLKQFQDIDAYVRSLPKAKSIDGVAAQLQSRATSDWEKVRAAFIWMTENVEYDVDSFFGHRRGQNSPDDVFANGKSVCEGYASLFQVILQRLGIEVVKVSGYAKGYGYSQGDRFHKTDHAWNAVKIDGAWHLFDSTWGAGSVDDRRFIKEYQEFWFDTPPELFVISHLPEDPRWTLLNRKITLSDYEQMLYIKTGQMDRLAKLGFDKRAILAGIESGSLPDTYGLLPLAVIRRNLDIVVGLA